MHAAIENEFRKLYANPMICNIYMFVSKLYYNISNFHLIYANLISLTACLVFHSWSVAPLLSFLFSYMHSHIHTRTHTNKYNTSHTLWFSPQCTHCTRTHTHNAIGRFIYWSFTTQHVRYPVKFCQYDICDFIFVRVLLLDSTHTLLTWKIRIICWQNRMLVATDIHSRTHSHFKVKLF